MRRYYYYHAYSELVSAIAAILALTGDWSDIPANGVWTYECRNGAKLHWSETTYRLWFDGTPRYAAELERLVITALGPDIEEPGRPKG